MLLSLLDYKIANCFDFLTLSQTEGMFLSILGVLIDHGVFIVTMVWFGYGNTYLNNIVGCPAPLDRKIHFKLPPFNTNMKIEIDPKSTNDNDDL